MLESVIVQVVTGEHWPQLANRATGDPLPRLCLAAATDRAEAGPTTGRRVIGPVERAARLVENVDPGAVGAEKSCRFIDSALEDILGVAEGDDPSADLPQGALGLGAPLDVRPGAPELLDEIGVRHGRGGVIGEGTDQSDFRVPERIDPACERAHRADRSARR